MNDIKCKVSLQPNWLFPQLISVEIYCVSTALMKNRSITACVKFPHGALLFMLLLLVVLLPCWLHLLGQREMAFLAHFTPLILGTTDRNFAGRLGVNTVQTWGLKVKWKGGFWPLLGAEVQGGRPSWHRLHTEVTFQQVQMERAT